MIFTEKEIRTKLRKHLKRKLKLGGGHCQVTIRRLGKCIYAKNGVGYKYKEEPTIGQRQMLYRVAEELCLQYGGVRIGDGYNRNNGRGQKVARCYQF